MGLVDETEVLRHGATPAQEAEHEKRQQKNVLNDCSRYLSNSILSPCVTNRSQHGDALRDHFERDSETLFLLAHQCIISVLNVYGGDVFDSVLQLYYRSFYHMEQSQMLDPLNPVHLFCLHYSYLPKINKVLTQSCAGWNNHPMSSCKGKTPLQMFVGGINSLKIRHLENRRFWCRS